MSGRADTIFDFTLVNVSTTMAYDAHVSFSQNIKSVQSNLIYNNASPPVSTNNSFGITKVTPAGGMQVDYTMPTGNETVAPGYSLKATVSAGPGLKVSVTAPTYFTDVNSKQIPGRSARVVAANIDVNQDPRTGIASVSIGNPIDDYLFLSNIEVWTGLTAMQATNLDAGGNIVTSDLPAIPSESLSALDLSPGQGEQPEFVLGTLPANSYIVVLYDLADGPDSIVSDATDFGDFFVSVDSQGGGFDVVTPEPGTAGLALVGTAIVFVQALAFRKRGRQAMADRA